MNITADKTKAVLLIGGAVAIGLYIIKRGGIAEAASSAGQAAGGAVVDLVGGAATGVIGGVSTAVGLPTPAQTTTDEAVARWLIDNFGYWEASKWCGLPALVKGAAMDAGTGVPPPANSPIGREFLPKWKPQASYDESNRLASRYPAPSVGYYDTAGRSAGSGSGSLDERSFTDLSGTEFDYWSYRPL